MNKLIFVLLFLTANLFADGIAEDKLKHFGISFGLTKGGIWLFEDGLRMERTHAKIMSSLLVLSLGIAKEYTDKQIDGKDILADSLGVLTANIINIKLEF